MLEKGTEQTLSSAEAKGRKQICSLLGLCLVPNMGYEMLRQLIPAQHSIGSIST